ncbi:MAG TPA: thiamine phosphate synthase [Acidiferrobacteraceae bacterium]|nr:thiamine phosphate synthase [Acidiferrobacteraceae bacterium]
MTPLAPSGLYLLADGQQLRDPRLGAILRAGVSMLQYRDKAWGATHAELRRVRALCAQHRIAFVVNDNVELAQAVGADAVHLGIEDGPVNLARARLGPSVAVGASCYADLDRAQQMVHEGADYLAFGSFYPSTTKPGACRATPDLLTQARTRWRVPLVAIGGITPDNGAVVRAAGADLLAVASGVWAAPDPVAMVARYLELFRGG